MSEVKITRQDHVAIVELQRAPNNFVDIDLISDIADAYDELDADKTCRAIVLCSHGKHFCAGANLAERAKDDNDTITQEAGRHLYQEAHRLISNGKPVVAAIQGAAVGAGIGLALTADFRVGCAESRLSANFARQGYHPGFGTTYTLPRIVGRQKAAWMFYTGERVPGEEALEIGLLDRLVSAPPRSKWRPRSPAPARWPCRAPARRCARAWPRTSRRPPITRRSNRRWSARPMISRKVSPR